MWAAAGCSRQSSATCRRSGTVFHPRLSASVRRVSADPSRFKCATARRNSRTRFCWMVWHRPPVPSPKHSAQTPVLEWFGSGSSKTSAASVPQVSAT